MSSEKNLIDVNSVNIGENLRGYVILTVLLCIALFIVLGNFPSVNDYYYGADEGIYLSQATAIRENGIGGLKKIAEEYIGSPEKQLFPTPLRIFHITIIGILLSLSNSISVLSYYSVFCFVATAIVSFVFVKKFWGQKIALITACFMMFSPVNMGVARRALMDSSYTLFTLITLALFVNFVSSKTNRNYTYFISSLVFLLLYKETTYFYMPFFVLALLAIKYFVDKSLEFNYIIKTALIPPIASFFVYLFVFGSLGNIVAIFKALFLPNFLIPLQYAVDYCSGPWYHYLIDFLIVSPIISVLFFLYTGYYFSNAKKYLPMSLLMGFFIYFLIVFSLFFKNIRYGMVLNFVYTLSAALMLVHLADVYLNPEKTKEKLGSQVNIGKPLKIGIVILVSIFSINTYGRVFIKDGIYDPVIFNLLKSEKMLPNNVSITQQTKPNEEKSEIAQQAGLLEQIGKLSAATIESPNETNYVNLSLNYYQAKLYQEAVKMAEKALEINPKSTIAYNNICSSYIFLGEYDKAIDAANKAIEIDPNFQLSKNNLNWAKDMKAKATSEKK